MRELINNGRGVMVVKELQSNAHTVLSNGITNVNEISGCVALIYAQVHGEFHMY